MSWAHIARQLERGVDWPVSGPAFIAAVRALAHQLGADYPTALAWLGVCGTFVAVCALLWSHRRIGVATAPGSLLALALTSYFWAPLLEARPQQWGQAMVLATAVSAWLWMGRRGGWGFFVLLALVAFTHILSHAVLVWLCATLVIADWVEGRPLTPRHAIVLVALLASALIYVWPGGPYAHMLDDVRQNHVPRLLAYMPELALATACAGLAAGLARRRWHGRTAWLQAAAVMLERRRALVLGCGGILLLVVLALQASILPSAAWEPYGGSVWRFLLLQSGNLLFMALFATGVFELARQLRSAEVAPAAGRLLIWSFVALGALGLVTVLASHWMLHRNWLLRLLNYGVLFGAPVAAVGLAHATRRCRPRWLLGAGVVLSIGASTLSTLRPPGILGC